MRGLQSSVGGDDAEDRERIVGSDIDQSVGGDRDDIRVAIGMCPRSRRRGKDQIEFPVYGCRVKCSKG